MAWEGDQVKVSRVAGADLSAKQYHFVKLDANGDVVACDGATDKPFGVLQNDPASGEEASICILGISKVVADAALNEGDSIGPSADGQADAKVEGTDSTEYVGGQMLTAPGGAGVVGTAFIYGPHRAA